MTRKINGFRGLPMGSFPRQHAELDPLPRHRMGLSSERPVMTGAHTDDEERRWRESPVLDRAGLQQSDGSNHTLRLNGSEDYSDRGHYGDRYSGYRYGQNDGGHHTRNAYIRAPEEHAYDFSRSDGGYYDRSHHRRHGRRRDHAEGPFRDRGYDNGYYRVPDRGDRHHRSVNDNHLREADRWQVDDRHPSSHDEFGGGDYIGRPRSAGR